MPVFFGIATHVVKIQERFNYLDRMDGSVSISAFLPCPSTGGLIPLSCMLSVLFLSLDGIVSLKKKYCKEEKTGSGLSSTGSLTSLPSCTTTHERLLSYSTAGAAIQSATGPYQDA